MNNLEDIPDRLKRKIEWEKFCLFSYALHFKRRHTDNKGFNMQDINKYNDFNSIKIKE